jgi:hypothetical protein
LVFKSNIGVTRNVIGKTCITVIMMEVNMPVNINDDQGPRILEAARSVIGMAKTTGNTDCLKDIFEFIVTVLKQAGFDLTRNAVPGSDNSDLPKTSVLMDWFDRIGEKTVSPGDLISYAGPGGRETLGLIESYDMETRTGTMYAMDGPTGGVSSIDFTETDVGGTGFLRPKMDLFVGNLTELFAGIEEEYDEDHNQHIGPSPGPY